MRRKLVVAGGLVVVIIIAITVINGYLKTHTPTRQLSQKFISYVLSDDSASSYALFSSKAQSLQSQSDWQLTVQTMSSIFKDKSPTYVSTASSSQGTTETYSINSFDGQSYNFVLLCVKDGGNWKVFSFVSKSDASTSTNSTSGLGS